MLKVESAIRVADLPRLKRGRRGSESLSIDSRGYLVFSKSLSEKTLGMDYLLPAWLDRSAGRYSFTLTSDPDALIKEAVRIGAIPKLDPKTGKAPCPENYLVKLSRGPKGESNARFDAAELLKQIAPQFDFSTGRHNIEVTLDSSENAIIFLIPSNGQGKPEAPKSGKGKPHAVAA